MTPPRLIGIAGASGSGKTRMANQIVERFGTDRVALIQEDSYYRDLSHMPLDMRADVNFDHPDAFDHDLLVEHLRQLLNGQSVSCPEYDYKTHNRLKQTRPLTPCALIVLEGILTLCTAQLRDLMDMRVFVDTTLDVCCERRIERDMSERGRSRASIVQQFEDTVRPMYRQFIEPSRQYADLVIPGVGEDCHTIDLLVTRIQTMLDETHSEGV